MEANYTLLQTNLSLQKETIIEEAAINSNRYPRVPVFYKTGPITVNLVGFVLVIENDYQNEDRLIAKNQT